jgi:metal-responsive CopG/Arc/MetJ family transcriptional regulator
MPAVSVNLPRELKEEIEELIKEEDLEENVALRKLLKMAISEWKKEKALKLLTDGKISYLKAAEKTWMNVWDFAELLREKKVVWIKDAGIFRDLNARL